MYYIQKTGSIKGFDKQNSQNREFAKSLKSVYNQCIKRKWLLVISSEINILDVHIVLLLLDNGECLENVLLLLFALKIKAGD